MGLKSRTPIAIAVQYSSERVRLLLEDQGIEQDGDAVPAVSILVQPGRGEVGESVSLAAMEIIRAQLDAEGVRHTASVRRHQKFGPMEYVTDGVTIPKPVEGLVPRLLTAVSHMGNIG